MIKNKEDDQTSFYFMLIKQVGNRRETKHIEGYFFWIATRNLSNAQTYLEPRRRSHKYSAVCHAEVSCEQRLVHPQKSSSTLEGGDNTRL